MSSSKKRKTSSSTPTGCHTCSEPTGPKKSNNNMLFGVDVECAELASGQSTAIRVALVNESGRCLVNEFVKPTEEIRDLRTKIHGITAHDLRQKGLDFTAAVAKITAILPPNALLVGQGIEQDITWLGLVRGRHYGKSIDTATLYPGKPHPSGGFYKFGLGMMCTNLLGRSQPSPHVPDEDARLALALYKHFCDSSTTQRHTDARRLETLRQQARCRAPRKCYKCGQEGHIARNCRSSQVEDEDDYYQEDDNY